MLAAAALALAAGVAFAAEPPASAGKPDCLVDPRTLKEYVACLVEQGQLPPQRLPADETIPARRERWEDYFSAYGAKLSMEKRVVERWLAPGACAKRPLVKARADLERIAMVSEHNERLTGALDAERKRSCGSALQKAKDPDLASYCGWLGEHGRRLAADAKRIGDAFHAALACLGA